MTKYRLKEVLFSKDQLYLVFEYLEYDLLALCFRHLPFAALGTLALVSKRWRSVATDPSWKPELIVLAWGRQGFTGLPGASACPRPTLLPFAMEREVLQAELAVAKPELKLAEKERDLIATGAGLASSQPSPPQQPVSAESDDLPQLVALMQQQGMAAPACD